MSGSSIRFGDNAISYVGIFVQETGLFHCNVHPPRSAESEVVQRLFHSSIRF